MATKLKFEIFDVYDRKETKVCPIGAAQCQVMDLLRSPDQSQRHEILFDRSTCGYLTVKATKVSNLETQPKCKQSLVFNSYLSEHKVKVYKNAWVTCASNIVKQYVLN